VAIFQFNSPENGSNMRTVYDCVSAWGLGHDRVGVPSPEFNEIKGLKGLCVPKTLSGLML